MVEDDLYLGTTLAGDESVHLDMNHLTTHAVCLGMTGSGKTGLGLAQGCLEVQGRDRQAPNAPDRRGRGNRVRA